MLNRKNLAVTFVIVLLVSILAGCSTGAAMVPDRTVEVSMDAAMSAQNKAMQGLMAGSVEWTESEFSSLATALIKQNLGEGAPITGVTAYFDPGNKLTLVAGLPGGISATLSGSVLVENNRVQVALTDANAGGVSVSGALLDVIAGAINRALDDPSLGVAVGVETGEGTLSLALGQ